MSFMNNLETFFFAKYFIIKADSISGLAIECFIDFKPFHYLIESLFRNIFN